MLEGNEQLNSDVNNEASSELQSQAAESTQEQSQEAASANQSTQQDNVPFNEHPRFRELIDEKNTLKTQLAEMQAQIQRLSTPQQPQTKEEKDAMVERLMGIDPEFGKDYAGLKAALKELNELKAWKQQTETQSIQEKAVTSVNQLHEQNKVPAELRDMYNAALEAEARKNPRMTLNDLPNAYKAVHERFTKYIDSVKRSERESYVSDKRSDARAPSSQPKGRPVTGSTRKEFSSDPGEARQQTVSEVLKLMRAEKDI